MTRPLILRGLLLLGALLSAPAPAIPTLTLDPGGMLSGVPGATVGWGFTLSNDGDYLVVTGADFTGAGSLGVFTDFIGPNFIVVGPPPETTPLSQPFDPNALTGIGSFAIAPGAVMGSVANGQIVLSYDLFSVSPNDASFDPDLHTLSNGNTLTANASVSVQAGAVPEPSPLALMALGSVAVLVGQRSGPRPRNDRLSH